MKEKTDNILDIHTHQSENASQGKAIINYQLLTDSPLNIPLAESADVAESGELYSVGIHPWELTECNAERQLRLLKELIAKKKFVAVGEAGLDKLAATPIEVQITIFKAQVKLSEKCELPLIIHCVKAMEELLAVRKELQPVQPWIWHGFRGKAEQAKQLVKQGFYLSFGEHYDDAAIASIPADRLFLETDDAGIDIESILQRAAKVRGVEVDALRHIIHENVQKVFFKG